MLLETCGQFDWERAEKHLLPYVDDIFCDVKILDREKHKKYCGVYNDRILENIRRMWSGKERLGYSFLPRTPLIPGITDTEENLTEIAAFLSELGIERAQLLAYNPTWYPKNDKLGLRLCDELKGVDGFQSREQLDKAKKIFSDKNIIC